MNNLKQLVSKGNLIGIGYPYVKQCRGILTGAILVAAFFVLLALVSGSIIGLIAAVCALGGGVVLWLYPGRIVREVRIYENGLERRVARDPGGRYMFLPWKEVSEYRWDGDVLRFNWGGDAFLLFQGGEIESSLSLNGVRP